MHHGATTTRNGPRLRPYLDTGRGLLLALPWLFPFAAGPSPAIQPWLFTLFIAALLLAWAGLQPADEEGFARSVAVSWVLAAAFSSAAAVVQYAGGSAAFGPWINETPPGLAYANLRQRNQFATLTVMGAAAVLMLAQVAWLERRAVSHMAMGLVAAGNALSTSRTGALALLAVLAMAWAWSHASATRRHMHQLLATAAATYIVVALAAPVLLSATLGVDVPTVFARMATDAGCSSRVLLWSNVLDLIVQRPWLGWGWGELDYAHFITASESARFCDILDNAHNLPLHLAVELGLPAAFAVCGLAVVAVLWLKPWQEAQPARQLAWGVLAALALHSLTEYPLWYGPFVLALGLCCVLLLPRRTTGHTSARRWWFFGAAAVLLGATAYATWDYHRISQLYEPPHRRSAAYRAGTLEKVRGSWLFRDQVQFAELTTTPVTSENAARTVQLATALLHYSPEPRVIERLVESLVMLGRDAEALAYLARYRAAFPTAYEAWRPSTAASGPAQD